MYILGDLYSGRETQWAWPPVVTAVETSVEFVRAKELRPGDYIYGEYSEPHLDSYMLGRWAVSVVEKEGKLGYYTRQNWDTGERFQEGNWEESTGFFAVRTPRPAPLENEFGVVSP